MNLINVARVHSHIALNMCAHCW